MLWNVSIAPGAAKQEANTLVVFEGLHWGSLFLVGFNIPLLAAYRKKEPGADTLLLAPGWFNAAVLYTFQAVFSLEVPNCEFYNGNIVTRSVKRFP